MKVIHVCSASTARGSRIEAQVQAVEADVIALGSMLPKLSLVSKLAKNKNSTFIFHEQYSLVTLFIVYITSFFLSRKNNFIYDIHDILRKKSSAPLKAKLIFYPLYFLESWVLKRGPIKLVTVSSGLADYYKELSERTVEVFYNLIPGHFLPSKEDSEKRIDQAIYFGQIYEARITSEDVRKLSKQGLSVSLSGRFPASSTEKYRQELLHEVDKSGGKFLGEYAPSDLDFLKQFSYSIMLFGETSENIIHCMPNKLFQSLSYGLTCLVSPHLKEVISNFYDTGFVRTSEEKLNRFREKDFDKLNDKLRYMNERNHLVLKGLVGNTGFSE